VFTIRSPQHIVCGYIFRLLDVLPLRCHQCSCVPDCQTATPLPLFQEARRVGNTTDSYSSRYWPGKFLIHGEILTQCRADLGCAGGWGALGTAQHHLTSNLDEYTTSDRDERGSQAVTFFSFPGTALYKARFTNALSLYQLNYQLYISVTTVLYIKCIFSQWMQVLPREREQVLLPWRRSTVLRVVQ
jgi:hypothetical protein